MGKIIIMYKIVFTKCNKTYHIEIFKILPKKLNSNTDRRYPKHMYKMCGTVVNTIGREEVFSCQIYVVNNKFTYIGKKQGIMKNSALCTERKHRYLLIFRMSIKQISV